MDDAAGRMAVDAAEVALAESVSNDLRPAQAGVHFGASERGGGCDSAALCGGPSGDARCEAEISHCGEAMERHPGGECAADALDFVWRNEFRLVDHLRKC